MRTLLPILLLLVAGPAPAQTAPTVTPVASGSAAEFRGLHVHGDAIWASGSAGRFSVSRDAGASWRADSIPGAGAFFLVDVHGFDAQRAVVAATRFDGGAARIYRTQDGGASWQEAWRLEHPNVFLDFVTFFDETRGFAFSDPVDGSFLVLRTEDGGASWTRVDGLPAPLPGEAAFAASGTGAAAVAGGYGWFATGGGSSARVLRTRDYGRTWAAAATPLPGAATAGIFGIAFADTLHGVAIGGDFQQPQLAAPNVLRTSDGGDTWTLAGSTTPAGVKYGVAWQGERLIAPAPAGTAYSLDGGRTWHALTTASYNTAAFAADGTAWLAGIEGGLAKVTFPQPPGRF
jgi:photosystem II stability/assembly factor-like uncharacterized protein